MAPGKDIERKLSRLFVVGFPGNAPDADLARLVKAGLGGVILFSRNLPSCEAALELNRALLAWAGSRPLLLCLDQEGGRVQRLKAPLLQLPAMRRLGDAGDEGLCRDTGVQLGRELAALGYHLDLAPVLDVDTNPKNPVIADRSFSRDSERVAHLGVAFALGLQQGGVGACAKHFPGHGDTSQDSHRELPMLRCDWPRLRAVELPPFQEAARRGVASLMMAHLLIPVLDPKEATSLSPAAYRLARGEVGFGGLVLTDDLEMAAVAERPGVVGAAVAAIGAGADGVLVCNHPALAAEAIEAAAKAVGTGELDLTAIEQSGRRWDAFARAFGMPTRRPDPEALAATFRSAERADIESRLAALREGS